MYRKVLLSSIVLCLIELVLILKFQGQKLFGLHYHLHCQLLFLFIIKFRYFFSFFFF